MPTNPAPQPVKQWAILELFGHTKIAGAVSEQSLGGAQLVRVDVPEVSYEDTDWEGGQRRTVKRTIAAHTSSYGPSAIFGVHWVDEATALLMAHSLRHQPVSRWQLKDALGNLPTSDRVFLLGNGEEG